jgi:hypothetical protein
MIVEILLLIKLKMKYFRRFWSLVDVGLVICAWAYVGISVWRYIEIRRISDLFAQTNGYLYINLQLATSINDSLIFLLAFSSYLGSIRCLRLCQYHSRFSLFTATLSHAWKELMSFAMMFAIVFVAFLCLFYFLFSSELSTCSTMLRTAASLFEMTLLKFDASELSGAASFLGPFCLTLFVMVVVFVCLSMFLSIITESFRYVRLHNDKEPDRIFQLMWTKMMDYLSRIDARDGADDPCMR